MNDSVLAQLAALPGKTTPELKQLWRELYDREAPSFNRDFLIKRLAYRIQELAYGGLSARAEAKLDRLIAEEEARLNGKLPKRSRDRPIAGTRLIREWKGVEHAVTVLADGYEYQGRPYKSLSAIARAITGTRWNGPVFFGAPPIPEREMKATRPQAPLRHLHPQVHRRGPRDGVQLPRRPARGGARLHRRARSTRAGCSSPTATTTAASPAARWSARRCSGCCATSRAGASMSIVVYKVDRLSRSLIDFARIVEVFDKHNVSFVCVTQQFNTTTSMGRLTLNILLSFAQFEREVIGERIRDKFAASRRKGMWMGGTPPLGYDVVDRKLVVNESEAELVRLIFKRFLRVGSATKLAQELRRAGHTTKSWTTQDGKHRAGKPIDKGAIYKILSNRIYLGEAVHKGTSYPGEHAGDHRSRDLGQGARHPRREYGRSRQRHARADAGVAARPDLRARRPRDDAVAHAEETASCTATTSPPTPSARATRNARCAACRRPRSRKRSSRRCGTCCARPRSSREPGRRRSTRLRCRSARSSRPSPTSRRCGTSSSRPSRRGSSGCWSSGSILSPDGMQVRLRAEGLQTLVEELRSREAKAA